jgi:DNA-directed RNA polymerase specialized sigma24 family protein
MTSHTGQEPPVLDVRNRPVFEAFYHREFPAIRAVVWALTGNVWTAEGVAQDAFLRRIATGRACATATSPARGSAGSRSTWPPRACVAGSGRCGR